MKSDHRLHTTNYYNTLIEVAEDYARSEARIPLPKGNKMTVAQLQFDLIGENPYRFTSDDVIFQVYSIRNEIPEEELQEAREIFFSKGQACLRASPLTKNYGFGVHANEEGKIAIYPMESETYKLLLADSSVQKVKAVRSSRKK